MKLIAAIENTLEAPNDPHRSGGVHMSDILRRIAISMKYLKPEEWEDTDDSMMCFGMAWEEWYGRRMEEQNDRFLYHPGEFSRDGIACSPDGLELLDGGKLHMLHEIKFTSKSARHDPVKEQDGKWWLWLRQGMAYCAAVPSAVNTVVWHVAHINGSYEKFVIGRARVMTYTVEFTQAEINANWQMLLANKEG